MDDFIFFDIHCHPVVKTLFRPENSPLPVWEPIKPRLKVPDGVESQSALDQICITNNMQGTKMNLLCFTRNAIERGMTDQGLLFVASFIYPEYLDLKILIQIAHRANSYDWQLSREWGNLIKIPPDGQFANQQLHFLKSISEYVDAEDTLYLSFNIEGGHIFNQSGKICEDISIINIKTKLDEIQKECPIIFYFTPTHLTPNNLITHAYGNKILSNKPFIPRSFGICETGKLLIEELYSRDILVDVKHMSLISRQEFYDLHNASWQHMPIIASHVGFTGLSWKNLAARIRPVCRGIDFVKIEQEATHGRIMIDIFDPVTKTLNSGNTRFNPNSINLYDEDIENILLSGGLIGIIFDVRILGAEIKDTVTEFLSKQEYEKWHEQSGDPNWKINASRFKEVYEESTEQVFYKDDDVDEYLEELELYFPINTGYLSDLDYRNKSEKHLLHFINHILYIADLCIRNGIPNNPWKQICMGSDYDGLIAAMYCCRNVTNLPDFAKQLRDRIPMEAVKAGITMPTLDIDEFIQDFFYNNAMNLLKKRYP